MPDIQKVDVPNSVKFFEDLAQLVMDALGAVKSRNIWDMMKLLPEIQMVVKDAKSSLPELMHLSPEDALMVGAAAYECVKKIVSAV